MSQEEKIKLCGSASIVGASSAIIKNDKDFIVREYDKKFAFDVSKIKRSYLYNNVCRFYIDDENNELRTVDQGFIGGCLLGEQDYIKAASLLKGKKINSTTKLIISFPSNDLFIKLIDKGVVDIFLECGAIILNSGCGACSGGCQGKISSNQLLITTSYYDQKYQKGDVIYTDTEKVIEACLKGKVCV